MSFRSHDLKMDVKRHKCALYSGLKYNQDSKNWAENPHEDFAG